MKQNNSAVNRYIKKDFNIETGENIKLDTNIKLYDSLLENMDNTLTKSLNTDSITQCNNNSLKVDNTNTSSSDIDLKNEN